MKNFIRFVDAEFNADFKNIIYLNYINLQQIIYLIN